MCTVIEQVTNIPSQFLLGVTELYTASVAQRMSWAAQRDTKRKEDLAYCLLGIFGVAMPMIYGEGGHQAFFRLQEQIMKTTRDDSIFAWGFDIINEPAHASSTITAGGILASAPSDFANSGHIVTRQPSTVSLNSVDISGGSLRIYLSLLSTSDNITIGLLNCGPEFDPNSVVGVPLAKATAKSSEEYVRPRGYHSVLLPTAASRTSPKLLYIRHDTKSSKSVDAKQLYWHYGGAFAELNLDLVEVIPQSYWNKERALIVSPPKPNGRPTLARFCLIGQKCQDFIFVLESEERGSDIQPRCHVLICCRSTSLEHIAKEIGRVKPEVLGKTRASNGFLNLQVSLEPVGRQAMFIIKPEVTSDPPDVTINATVLLQKFDLDAQFSLISVLKLVDDEEEHDLIVKMRAGRNDLEKIHRRQREVHDKLKELVGKRRILANEEGQLVRQMQGLEVKYAGVLISQERTSRRWLHFQKRLDQLLRTQSSADSYELEQTLLRWAAEDGDVNVVQLLLDNGVNPTVKDDNGCTPLSLAEAKGHMAVVGLLQPARALSKTRVISFRDHIEAEWAKIK